MTNADESSEANKNRWTKFWRVPTRRYLLGIPAGGFLAFVVGIMFWGGLHWSVELSNTEAFCISCHEMRDNVYEEYTSTIHYHNRTGVRAICSDCHVPREWGAKMAKKMNATLAELPGWVMGTINTREKFEAKRLELATNEWERLKANDSRECRNCHALEHMDLEMQGRSASRRHAPERIAARGETCIDCHQGVAHTLPEGWEDIELWASREEDMRQN